VRISHGTIVATKDTTMSTSNNPPQRTVILAAVDGSAASSFVVAGGAKFAAMPGAELHLVHVIDAVGETKRLTEQLERGRQILEDLGKDLPESIPLTLHLAAGSPTREILQLAANLQADLIVVGAHDLSALEKLLLGSVAEPVVRKAQCPVYVVRRKDYHGKVVPELEPPCPDCLQTQRSTGGKELWCARHAQRHSHGHLHYEMPTGFAQGSSLLRP
jgi:nucleotide-binding universal stress UspA family protein